MKYKIVNNHNLNGCHPETCTCMDYALVDENYNVQLRSDDKEELELYLNLDNKV